MSIERAKYWNTLTIIEEWQYIVEQTALVLLGMDEFSWDKFLLDLVSISYTGDIRFLLHAESPNKMRNIVGGSRDQLMSIYQPICNELKALSKQQLRELLPPLYKENNWKKIKAKNTTNSTLIALSQLLANKPTNIYRYCQHKLTTK
jgi:Phosphatidate cytidylyltransferase, mitochondrial